MTEERKKYMRMYMRTYLKEWRKKNPRKRKAYPRKRVEVDIGLAELKASGLKYSDFL